MQKLSKAKVQPCRGWYRMPGQGLGFEQKRIRANLAILNPVAVDTENFQSALILRRYAGW